MIILNNYISNNYKSQIAYVEHNSYKLYDNITFNKTNNISKPINQYTTDAVNNYKDQQGCKSKQSCIIIVLMMLLLINIIPYTLMIIPM